MIFWIFPIVPCHAFCMWHWPIGKNLDSSFIWGHHHLIVSIWISVYQLNTSYSLLRRTDETQQGRNSCLRLQMLASVWTLSCHCPVKLLTQYQPCIIVCYSVYFWLIRSFTDPAFTGSIFVCGPLHHHVLLPLLKTELSVRDYKNLSMFLKICFLNFRYFFITYKYINISDNVN